MDEIEIIMFKEVNDYSEKFYGLTFRQWIFSAIALLFVVPTYTLLPKYTPISQDIASYIVILEAGIIGFFGFIKINNLPAEHIVPYWYRHFICFGKPIKYISDTEWEAMHDKKNKKAKKSEAVVENVPTEVVQETELSKPKLSKKQLKQQRKKEKMLAKAKKKYGYLLDDNVEENKEIISETIVTELPVNDALDNDDEIVRNVDAEITDTNKSINNDVNATDVLSQLSPQQKEALIKALQNNNE